MTSPLLHEIFQPRVLLVIGTHWTVAISLVFVNKQLVSAQQGGPDLTVFIAWSQCLFSILAIVIAASVKWCLSPKTTWLNISLATFFQSDVMAMTFTFIAVIVMNNLLLKHIGVAFYQVARSSTLIFTVVFSRFFLGVRVTLPVMASCFLIMLGFVISVDQEMVISSLSLKSISYGVLASMSAALGGIFTKRAVKFVQGNTVGVTLTNNANAVLFLLPLLLSTGQLRMSVSSDFLDTRTCLKLCATGVLSLLTGWASIKVISLTSPLTLHMSINAKSLLQTLIAVMMEGEPKTVTWWIGNCLVILGIMNYGLSKDPVSDSQHSKVIYISSDNMASKREVNTKDNDLLTA
ncbi:GDP-fucose transporter 1-like [Babylonia areolata]|uniref:GDP-fucose transporter 1-like n=1 Tax=Babylonia areolata TaxID=304850 RepID=UPI003FCF4FFE